MADVLDVPVVRGADLILRGLNQKLTVGSKLTELEVMMGMTAEATNMARQFGPGPREMEVIEIPLPESLKGAIASAKG